jgi:hypothetical protein
MIYDYHTEQRKRHAKGRKLKPVNERPSPGGLTPLDDLDRDGK